MPRDKMALLEPLVRIGTPAGKYQVCGSPKMLMGYVVKTATVGYEMKSCVKVRVPRKEYNSYLKMFFPREDDFWAKDEQQSSMGDYVLIKEMENPFTVEIKHSVDKVVYQLGKVIDPVTKRRAFSEEFEDRVVYKSRLISDIIAEQIPEEPQPKLNTEKNSSPPDTSS